MVREQNRWIYAHSLNRPKKKKKNKRQIGRQRIKNLPKKLVPWLDFEKDWGALLQSLKKSSTLEPIEKFESSAPRTRVNTALRRHENTVDGQKEVETCHD